MDSGWTNTIIIVIVIIIAILIIYHSSSYNSSENLEVNKTEKTDSNDDDDDEADTGNQYIEDLPDPDPQDIPPADAYISIESPPDDRYIYFEPRNSYLLPFEYLDFTLPFHRWLYYYYPEYYYPYYDNYWPYYYPRRYYYGYYDNDGGYYGPSYGPIFNSYYERYPERYGRYRRYYDRRYRRRPYRYGQYTRGRRSSSPRGRRSVSPRGRRSVSPRGRRSVSPRGRRSSSPRGRRSVSPRGRRSSSPRGRSFSRGGRSFSPRGGRSFSPRGGRSFGGRGGSPRSGRSFGGRGGSPRGGRSFGGGGRRGGGSRGGRGGRSHFTLLDEYTGTGADFINSISESLKSYGTDIINTLRESDGSVSGVPDIIGEYASVQPPATSSLVRGPGSRFGNPSPSDYIVDTKYYPTRYSGFDGGWSSQRFIDGNAYKSGLTSGRAMGGFGGGSKAYGAEMTSHNNKRLYGGSGGRSGFYRGVEGFEQMNDKDKKMLDSRGGNSSGKSADLIPACMNEPSDAILMKDKPTVPYHSYDYRPTHQYVTDSRANTILNALFPNPDQIAASPIIGNKKNITIMRDALRENFCQANQDATGNVLPEIKGYEPQIMDFGMRKYSDPDEPCNFPLDTYLYTQ